MPRNSTERESHYDNDQLRLSFQVAPVSRRLRVEWPNFAGQPLSADIVLHLAPEHESTVVVIPIAGQRFYYNRKVNCLPAEGWLQIGEQRSEIRPDTCLGNLDWGRRVWEYHSFWVWASASGFLSDGRAVGLNLGFGFGDTSAATENTFTLTGRIYKLGQVDFSYDPTDYRRPWRMTTLDDRLDMDQLVQASVVPSPLPEKVVR